MKTISLRVGKKSTGREAVKVPLNVAENASDAMTLSKGNEKVFVRCFNRGWQIENQERSGARDAFGENKSMEDIANIVATYDPTQVKVRTGGGRKAAPKKIVLQKGKTRYSLQELQEALKAQGFEVETESAEVGQLVGA